VTTEKSDLDKLTILGSQTLPSKNLEAFPNRSPDRFYLVTMNIDEFTCLCPKTGQPDFAKIQVDYVPDGKVVESKSLKLYLWSYRNEAAFHEHVVNQIMDDLVKVLDPHWIQVKGIFNIRGGIGITVKSERTKTPAARTQWMTGSRMDKSGE
jgi:7-cyano-7-deazaguanine reductase